MGRTMMPGAFGAVMTSALAAACGGTTPVPVTTAGDDVPAERGRTYSLSFDSDPVGKLPADLAAPLGQWVVEADASAISAPNVFRQKGEFPSPDFPRVALKDVTFTDATVRVRCRPESGATDRACGIMFRFQDSDNYLITRANALEGNIRVYRVVDGDRQQFASTNRDVTAGAWHTYEASVHGHSIVIRWDGEEVISASDDTFARGKVGLWTKADSITAFDDFEAAAE